jgi:hypothetical protein
MHYCFSLVVWRQNTHCWGWKLLGTQRHSWKLIGRGGISHPRLCADGGSEDIIDVRRSGVGKSKGHFQSHSDRPGGSDEVTCIPFRIKTNPR